MLNPMVYDHTVGRIELIETHISWVILTGEFAYKIKKPVNFGFLDFSTLQKRRKCCELEIRLNRRLAADIYLDVVAITGTSNRPRVAVVGEAFEYAVKMKQFSQTALLDYMQENGELKFHHMDALARMVADFHQKVEVASEFVEYGNKSCLYHPVEENFLQIGEHLDTEPYETNLLELMQWSRLEFEKRELIFVQRKHDGYVRECHGDMHLRNLVWLNNRPAAFDCIEFNPQLSWIDVMSEVAFLVMDLQSRQQHDLAQRFLNQYLEATGDYAGLVVLPFYLCYRALVRAKVDSLRLSQQDITEREKEQFHAEFESYLQLATAYTHVSKPKLIIMFGLSASGKSTVSRQITDVMRIIRIRSDVERKRLFDMPLSVGASKGIEKSVLDTGVYSELASQQTYAKLAELAAQVIDAGYSVLIDAAFLQHKQRKVFQQLASRLGVSYIILAVTAPPEVLRQRIIERKNDISEANLSVLEHQLTNCKPPRDDEKSMTINVNNEYKIDIEKLKNAISTH